MICSPVPVAITHPLVGTPPPWFEAWTKVAMPDPAELFAIRAVLIDEPEPVRRLLTHFPLHSVVQCNCGPDCVHQIGRVLGCVNCDRHGLRLIVRGSDDAHAYHVPTRLRVVGYHAGLTPEVLWAILCSAGEA